VATKRVREVGDYVAWLRGTFTALEIENASVAGLSYGGWLAALLGVHAPELVNRLILMGPAGTFDRIATQWMVRMVSATILPSRSVAGRALQWAAGGSDTTSDPGVALAVTSMVSLGRSGGRSCHRPSSPTTSCGESAHPRPSCSATERSSTPADRKPLLRAQTLIPNVHALLLPSAGHILTLDAPDVVLAEMTEALT
jgi:pimeloyl-ACP methyl ester carboxylesterase